MSRSNSTKREQRWIQRAVTSGRKGEAKQKRCRLTLESLEQRLLLASDGLSVAQWGLYCVEHQHEFMPVVSIESRFVSEGRLDSVVEDSVVEDSVVEDSVVEDSVVEDSVVEDKAEKMDLMEARHPAPLIVPQSAVAEPAEIVASFIYYPRSGFAASGMDGAIDPGKQPIAEGAEPQLASFVNVINANSGITGFVFDFDGLPGDNLTEDDFLFQMSPLRFFSATSNPPSEWDTAPNPQSISTVNSLDSSISRVWLDWPDGSIENRWLRITVLATENTGLLTPQVYYLGHLRGAVLGTIRASDTEGEIGFFEFQRADLRVIRQQVGQIASIESIYDLNKDGIVSFKDLRGLAGSSANSLPVITIPPVPLPAINQLAESYLRQDDQVAYWVDDFLETAVDWLDEPPALPAMGLPEVIASFAFHAGQSFSSHDAGKVLAQEGTQPQMLSLANLLNGHLGIGGIALDVANMSAVELNFSDFTFQMSPQGAFSETDNEPTQWELAPPPTLISVEKNELTQITRIRIEWPEGAIMNRWLRVAIEANENTGFTQREVFYLGHLIGKNTDWLENHSEENPSGVFELHLTDLLSIRQNVGQAALSDSLFDINKDGVISFQDIASASPFLGMRLSNITIPARLELPSDPLLTSALRPLIDEPLGIGHLDSNDIVFQRMMPDELEDEVVRSKTEFYQPRLLLDG